MEKKKTKTDKEVWDYEPTEEEAEALYDDDFNEWLENETFGVK